MYLRFGILFLGLVTTIGCTKQEEPQSVFVEFNIKTSDGKLNNYSKIVPLEKIDAKKLDIHTYECRVELDGNEYRLAFWCHIYPQITEPAIDIRYRFGNLAEGNSVAMFVEMFSVYNSSFESSMTAQIYRSEFLHSQKEQYGNIYKENLNCQPVD